MTYKETINEIASAVVKDAFNDEMSGGKGVINYTEIRKTCRIVNMIFEKGTAFVDVDNLIARKQDSLRHYKWYVKF